MAGVEPAVSRLEVGRVIHYATRTKVFEFPTTEKDLLASFFVPGIEPVALIKSLSVDRPLYISIMLCDALHFAL